MALRTFVAVLMSGTKDRHARHLIRRAARRPLLLRVSDIVLLDRFPDRALGIGAPGL
jgi:hypothetical protein